MLSALVVDDSSLIRTQVTHALRMGGFEVEEAKDGAEAYARFLERPFELVITDILMPVSCGLELLRSIRSLNAQIPVIVLTSASDRQIVEEARGLGANGYLLKPFEPAVLLTKIESVLTSEQCCP